MAEDTVVRPPYCGRRTRTSHATSTAADDPWPANSRFIPRFHSTDEDDVSYLYFRTTIIIGAVVRTGPLRRGEAPKRPGPGSRWWYPTGHNQKPRAGGIT